MATYLHFLSEKPVVQAIPNGHARATDHYPTACNIFLDPFTVQLQVDGAGRYVRGIATDGGPGFHFTSPSFETFDSRNHYQRVSYNDLPIPEIRMQEQGKVLIHHSALSEIELLGGTKPATLRLGQVTEIAPSADHPEWRVKLKLIQE